MFIHCHVGKHHVSKVRIQSHGRAAIAGRIVACGQLAAIVLAFLVPAMTACAGDWTGFRGPNGMGASDEKGLPAKWSSTDNIIWKTELPGPGASCPVTVGDKV